MKDQETVSRWERGKAEFTPEQELEFIRFLGFNTLDELLAFDLNAPEAVPRDASERHLDHVRTREYIAHLEQEIFFLRELLQRKSL